MKKYLRFLTVFLLAFLWTCLLAGCGGGNAGAEKNISETNNAMESGADSATAKDGALGGAVEGETPEADMDDALLPKDAEDKASTRAVEGEASSKDAEDGGSVRAMEDEASSKDTEDEISEKAVDDGTLDGTAGDGSESFELSKDGTYTSKEEVALYIHLYGQLPSNFITKKEAESLGWSGGSLEPYAPGMCIGGNRFGNYEGLLPEKDGRVYTECDIDTLGAEGRGAKRIVFSNDGLIYYTEDHYQSFELLYEGED